MAIKLCATVFLGGAGWAVWKYIKSGNFHRDFFSTPLIRPLPIRPASRGLEGRRISIGAASLMGECDGVKTPVFTREERVEALYEAASLNHVAEVLKGVNVERCSPTELAKIILIALKNNSIQVCQPLFPINERSVSSKDLFEALNYIILHGDAGYNLDVILTIFSQAKTEHDLTESFRLAMENQKNRAAKKILNTNSRFFVNPDVVQEFIQRGVNPDEEVVDLAGEGFNSGSEGPILVIMRKYLERYKLSQSGKLSGRSDLRHSSNQRDICYRQLIE